MQVFPSIRWASIGTLVVASAGLLVNMVLARLLSPTELGLYFMAFGMTSAIGMIAQMGLGQATAFRSSQLLGIGRGDLASRLITRTLGFAVIGSSIAVILTGPVIVPWVASVIFRSEELVRLSWLIALWIGFVAIQGYVGEVFRGLHEVYLATIYSGSVTSLLLLFVVSVFLIFAYIPTLSDIIIVIIGIIGVGASAGLLHVRNKAISLASPVKMADASAITGSVLPFAVPQLLANMANYVILSGDIWILAAYKPAHDVAVYSIAVRLMALITLPLMIVNLAIPGIVGRLYSMQSYDDLIHLLRKTATLAFIPTSAGLALLVISPSTVITVLFGASYTDAQTAVRILVIGYVVHVAVGSSGVVLMMTGKQRYLLVSTGIGAFVMVSLGMLLVDVYGISGIAVAASTGLTVQKSLTWWFAKKYAGISTHIDLVHLPQYLSNAFNALSGRRIQ